MSGGREFAHYSKIIRQLKADFVELKEHKEQRERSFKAYLEAVHAVAKAGLRGEDGKEDPGGVVDPVRMKQALTGLVELSDPVAFTRGESPLPKMMLVFPELAPKEEP